MKYLYLSYYAILSAGLAGMAVYTIFIGSLYVPHSKEVQKLARYENALQEQKQSLEQELSLINNSESLEAFAMKSDFHSISHVQTISDHATLAQK